MESLRFKSFMAQIPCCVAVIATTTGSTINSCTVSSLTSFDIDNPGVIITLKKDSRTLVAIQHSGVFSASILSEHQTNLAKYFSSESKNVNPSGDELFDIHLEFCIPYLKASQNTVFCELYKVLELENTSLVFGRVVDLSFVQHQSPLIYARRQYFTLGKSLL